MWTRRCLGLLTVGATPSCTSTWVQFTFIVPQTCFEDAPGRVTLLWKIVLVNAEYLLALGTTQCYWRRRIFAASFYYSGFGIFCIYCKIKLKNCFMWTIKYLWINYDKGVRRMLPYMYITVLKCKIEVWFLLVGIFLKLVIVSCTCE